MLTGPPPKIHGTRDILVIVGVRTMVNFMSGQARWR